MLGLMHPRMTLSHPIPDRGRFAAECRIDSKAFIDDKPVVRQQYLRDSEDAFGRKMLFKQTAEFERGGGSLREFVGQMDGNKDSDGLGFVGRVFSTFFAVAEMMLSEGLEQHALCDTQQSLRAKAHRADPPYFWYLPPLVPQSSCRRTHENNCLHALSGNHRFSNRRLLRSTHL